jgi:hypothetical protein
MSKRHALLTAFGLGIGLAGSYLLATAYRKARATCPPFGRPVYHSGRELAEACREFWLHPAELVALRQNERLSGPLAAKLMLAAASVEGSAYTGRLHAQFARRQGLGADEVRSLARGEVGSATVDEAPALFFAQHYVERRGQPDDDMRQRLVATYGERTAHDLVTFMSLVNLAKLVGNTFDAFLSRILGQPAPGSSLRGELSVLSIFALGIAPLVPVLALRVRRASMAQAGPSALPSPDA